MEKGFLNRVEDNTAVRVWSEKTQQEKVDSLVEGYESELWDFTRISVTQNDLCFTFGGIDLVPTVEEYMALFNCPSIQADRAYSRPVNVPPFVKKLIRITGMSEQWKRVDVFALSIYGLVVFPKALGYVDEAVSDLFDRLDKGTTPVPVILAETFRSLNACRRVGEGRFIGCAQLLLAWFHSHFWKAEKNLQAENVEWRAPWFIPSEILYKCGNFDWVLLAGIWGASGYTPLLVLRQYRSRQFIPAT
ncbi:hypothetical protein CXB51_036399 [Gossypium anomalum]|uniref:DUF7745 domain-containing protein n=1 Tax=Gossypium anomalum TaxID=47600 RepID=A0A8J5XZR8_9ROSI|nr:hypothetical protein CXB51_036399 [Gossypium anomalum]